MKKYLLPILFTCSILSSCKVFDPDEIIPSYIYVDDFVVNPTTSQGTASDNLTDAWVYVDGSYVGTWELPAKIPIHAEGNYNLQLFAGIKKSGFVAQRVTNQFMNSFDTTINSLPNNIDTLTPIITYESTASFWIEDFEDPGIKFTKLSYSDTNLVITLAPEEVFEGNGTGKIVFGSSDIIFESRTNETSFNSFPRGGKPVYLEMDYNSNEVLTVGIYHNNLSVALVKEEYINLNPTNGVWKKIYLDLTDIVSPQIRATEFEIYLEVQKDKSSSPRVLVDNIKVIF